MKFLKSIICYFRGHKFTHHVSELYNLKAGTVIYNTCTRCGYKMTLNIIDGGSSSQTMEGIDIVKPYTIFNYPADKEIG